MNREPRPIWSGRSGVPVADALRSRLRRVLLAGREAERTAPPEALIDISLDRSALDRRALGPRESPGPRAPGRRSRALRGVASPSGPGSSACAAIADGRHEQSREAKAEVQLLGQ